MRAQTVRVEPIVAQPLDDVWWDVGVGLSAGAGRAKFEPAGRGKTLEVNFRVEDPGTFNEPWSAIQRYRRVQRTMIEQVCAENNTPLFDYHTPVAEKPDF